MFVLKKGSLSMDDYDFDHLIDSVEEENYSFKDALKRELDTVGINIDDVMFIELTCHQMSNEKYCEIYSKII